MRARVKIKLIVDIIPTYLNIKIIYAKTVYRQYIFNYYLWINSLKFIVLMLGCCYSLFTNEQKKYGMKKHNDERLYSTYMFLESKARKGFGKSFNILHCQIIVFNKYITIIHKVLHVN